jgi:Tfp pilus assembly protein PilN
MARDINLLPPEKRMAKGVSRAIFFLRTLSTLFLGMITFFALSGIFLIFIFNRRLNDLKTSNQNLKTSVANLQSSEQSLVLVKDRTQKLERIFAKRENEDHLTKQIAMVNSLPEKVRFQKSELEVGMSRLGLASGSSIALSQLLKSISVDENLKDLKIEKINFNALLGFEVDLEVY